MSQKYIKSPVGTLLLEAEDGAITRLDFVNVIGRDDPCPVLDEAERQLRAYFEGKRKVFELPLAPEGTAFQRRVWAALREIPWGEVRSYGDIARRIGQPGATQAVGQANHRNPIAIFIPCHRVIGSRGSLTGYGGGLGRKRALLRLEGHDISEPAVVAGRYQDINAATIDRWIDEGWEWGRPIDHDTFLRAQQGDWAVRLTPTKPVPRAWFGDLRGKRVLGLASGGGQQMPIFAALGADCAVLDYSDKQIASERMVAAREGYAIQIVQADMTRPLPFEDESFDLIFHPVSNCYIREVLPVWRECFRVLKKGGALLSGLDNGVNFIVDTEEEKIVNRLPFDPVADPDQMRQLQQQDAGVQFSHTLEDQIGGQLRAGFQLTDLYEDTNGEGRLHALNIPSFIATRTVKP